jgi:hypothetical protein
MANYQFILEKSSKKFQCPACGKKTFVRYLDTVDRQYLPEKYGRCDRESNCNYHLSPYKDGYFKNKNHQDQLTFKTESMKLTRAKTVFIPQDVFKRTLLPDGYKHNNFIQNLLNNVRYPFDVEEIERVVSLYYLGTVSHGYRAGAITFPFIDFEDRICAIQVKQFDKNNHTSSTDFLHSIITKFLNSKNRPLPEWLQIYNDQELKVSCLFGESLVKRYPQNPIMLVEAPKTCVYGTLYFGFPEDSPTNFLWLSVYNLSSLNYEKCKVLKGRDVFLMPDLSNDGHAYKLWNDFVPKMNSVANFYINDFLEKNATIEDKVNGADIADILIRLDHKDFKSKRQLNQEIESPKQDFDLKVSENNNSLLIKNGWSQQITTLEKFYSSLQFNENKMMLNANTIIINVEKMINSHLEIIKEHKGNKAYLPYLTRLNELKMRLENSDMIFRK